MMKSIHLSPTIAELISSVSKKNVIPHFEIVDEPVPAFQDHQ